MANHHQTVDDYMEERFNAHLEEDGDDADSKVEIEGEANRDVEDVNLNDYDMLTKVTDTLAAQVRKGQDIQGIPWGSLNITRDDYRTTRISQYHNYENVPQSGETVNKECKPMEKGGEYYEFLYNSRVVKPTILHFQLRNLVWATSKHDVYLISNYSILHWSSMLHRLSEVLNFAGHVVPREVLGYYPLIRESKLKKHAGNLLEGFTQTQISTMAVRDRFMVAGGYQGEIICKCLDKPGVSFCTKATYEDNAITNAVEMYENISGGLNFVASNNDCCIRVFNMEIYELIHQFQFPWPVNHTSVSPDRRLLAVVGDDSDGLLVDADSGQTVASVVGHLDYSFASSWHPDGHTFATGNQDKTCRVWDIRNLSIPVAVLKGNMGAVRSIRFSSDGQFLVVAEAADFVHIYDSKADYKKRQEIDFFGEISGVSLSPDDESLFVGVWDRTYASLLQYNRRHQYGYIDSMI